MKCKYCGEEIANDSLFCENCGGKVMADENNPKPKVRWMLIALVVLLTGLTVVGLLVHGQKEKKRAELKDKYVHAMQRFDFNVNYILVDKEGREGAPNWVIGALKALQHMEKIKNDPLCNGQVADTTFDNRYDLFISRIKQARDNIYQKNKKDLDNGVHNLYYDEIRKRLYLMESILEQIQGESVTNVQIITPEKVE